MCDSFETGLVFVDHRSPRRLDGCGQFRLRSVAAAAVAWIVLVVVGTHAAAHDARAHERVVGSAYTETNRSITQTTHGDRPAAIRAGVRAVEAARDRLRASGAATTPAAQADHLSGDFCGSATGADDVTNAVDVARPKYRVVYAYPADQPDRFGEYAPRIAQTVKDVVDFVAASTGGQLMLRVDQGTSCGPQFLDLQPVRLPRSLGEYSAYGSELFDVLTADVRTAMGPPPAGQRTNVLLFADAVGTVVPYAGQGTLWNDDRPGPENLSNSGDNFAVVYGTGDSWFSSSERAYVMTTALHEVLHNLGGVVDGAPYATGAGHCWDEWDVLCYQDGGPTSQALTYPCPGEYGAELLDCGANTYFATSPEPGSWLASHWNVASSRYLCAPAACATRAQRPTASLVGPSSGTLGSQVTFDASGSTDADGRVVDARWRTSAGVIVDGAAGTTVSVRLVAPGSEWVEVQAIDDEGLESDPRRISLTVAPERSSTSWDTSWADGFANMRERRSASRPRRCRVPRLRGLTYRTARRRLRAAGCFHVRWRWTGRRSRGRVRSQSPRAGRTIGSHARVSVRLAPRR